MLAGSPGRSAVKNVTNASYRSFLSRYKEFALDPGAHRATRVRRRMRIVLAQPHGSPAVVRGPGRDDLVRVRWSRSCSSRGLVRYRTAVGLVAIHSRIGNKPFGISANLRHLCSRSPRYSLLQYDWRRAGL